MTVTRREREVWRCRQVGCGAADLGCGLEPRWCGTLARLEAREREARWQRMAASMAGLEAIRRAPRRPSTWDRARSVLDDPWRMAAAVAAAVLGSCAWLRWG